MARIPRKYYTSDYHHIMLRGSGRVDLFFDAIDYNYFIKKAAACKKESGIQVHCYCLMPNHVHFLIKGEIAKVSTYLQKLETSYAQYYNRKYEHVGHLFQNRYHCKDIHSDAYYSDVLRYILYNPQKAGICIWKNYSYSSAQTLLCWENDSLTDAEETLKFVGNGVDFRQFMNLDGDLPDLDAENSTNARTDEEAAQIIMRVTNLDSPLRIQDMSRKKQNEMLAEAKAAGISIRQIERVTGINRNIIQRAT